MISKVSGGFSREVRRLSEGEREVFAGRVRQLGDLVDAFERAVGGQPSVVLVGGEAGVGKTRLVAEFVALANAV